MVHVLVATIPGAVGDPQAPLSHSRQVDPGCEQPHVGIWKPVQFEVLRQAASHSLYVQGASAPLCSTDPFG